MSFQSIQTTTGAEPVQEDPKHIEAMIAKADGIQTPPAAEPTQTLLAGKYKSVEELERGYQELQKAFSSKAKPSEIPPTEEPATPPKTDLTIPEEAAAETLEEKVLDITSFNQEWQEKGELSSESYEKLAKAGIPKEMVDAYIEGQQVIAERLTTRVFDTVGGQEEYTKLMTWAATGVSTEERDTYNTIINSGDINQILLATKGLKASFEEARGKTPQLLKADGVGTAGNSDSFASKSQLTAAMADPRYTKDPAYREEVMMKLSRSNIF